jgi:choline-sulfatase
LEDCTVKRCLALLAVVFCALCCVGCPQNPPPPVGVTTPSSGSPGQTSTSGQTAPGQTGTKDFNVVLVSFDAMRAQETSVYNPALDTTPNLKKFAEGAIVFDNAIAPASWTLPSTLAIFTGLYPSHHGVTNKLTVPEGKDATLAAEVNTLPQLLNKAGYTLAAFTGDAGVSARFGYGRDFEVFVDDLKFGSFEHSMPLAEAWLEKNNDKKFFVFLHGYDCHGQHDPEGGYQRTYAKDYKGKLKGDKDEQGTFRELALKHKFDDGKSAEPHLNVSEFSKDDTQFYLGLYREKIHLADEKFGKFLEKMSALGLTDKTIFVLVADHGEEFMEHGNIDHGPTLYQEMIHVPLIIKIPGMAPRRIDTRVSSIDALPTVLAYLGIGLPENLDGLSLLPLIEGGKMPERDVMSETDYRLYSHKRAYFKDNYKLIVSLDNHHRELFDLKADPEEKHNIIAEQPDVAFEMEKKITTFMARMPYKSPVGQGDQIKVY